MPASNIKVFIRIRPSLRASKAFSCPPDSDGTIAFERDKDTSDGQVNNSKTSFKFKFDGILNMKVTQEEVFNTVAKPVIEDVLTGINGTIFAYGQTGSGKTFTITGAAEGSYEDRGLIPRTISYLFRAFQRGDANYRLFISYLEIYNDAGYDLISQEDTARKLEDLPKVQLREDEDGIHLKNLSVNMAQKEEDALNLLFLGDTNRVVAETPMNDASTRSHCMFILWVDSTVPGTDTVRRAKLHLVDLAGSERISKTGVEGNLQREARYINLSLHHLEQVIVALQERSQGHRTHVPYRNSTMTSVLRDSLGGNCKTVMVGTAAVEEVNVDETISTCRFAARVAHIKNNASVNEELDPQLLIKRLKKEASELKDELKLLSDDGGGSEELADKDLEECRQLVTAYLAETDPERPFVCGSAGRFRECFRILREVYWRRLEEAPAGDTLAVAHSKSTGGNRVGGGSGGDAAVGSLEAIVLELRQQVAQRDQELGILVSSMRKAKSASREPDAGSGRVFITKAGAAPSADASADAAARPAPPQPPADRGSAEEGATVDSAALLLDRHKAFEVFRKSFRKSETYEDNKQAQGKLMAEAKSCGERANAARAHISSKLHRVEQLRMQRALESSPRSPDDADSMQDGPEVAALLLEIKELKSTYAQNMEKLKQAKEGIVGYQKSAEQNKQRLQNDFEAWYLSLQRSQDGGGVEGGSSAGSAAQRSPVATSQSAQGSPGAEMEPLRSSMSSQASSADSVARSVPGQGPAPTRASGQDAGVWKSATPTGPIAGAWESSSKGRPPRLQDCPGSAPRPSSAGTAKLGQQGDAKTERSVSAGVAAPPSVATGDEQTDKDIAEYYAAFAELQR